MTPCNMRLRHAGDRPLTNVGRFSGCPPADGTATALAPDTSAHPAGSFQKNYTDLRCARKGGGRFWPISEVHKMKNGTYVIERILRGRWGALDRETLIERTAEDCRNDLSTIGVGFKVVIEQEPGSGGKDRPNLQFAISLASML